MLECLFLTNVIEGVKKISIHFPITVPSFLPFYSFIIDSIMAEVDDGGGRDTQNSQ